MVPGIWPNGDESGLYASSKSGWRQACLILWECGCRALLSLKNSDIHSIAKRIIDEQLSVRDVENFNSSIRSKKKKSIKNENVVNPEFKDVIDRLQYKFGTSVSILNGDKNGTISFLYFGREDLSRLIDLFLNEKK